MIEQQKELKEQILNNTYQNDSIVRMQDESDDSQGIQERSENEESAEADDHGGKKLETQEDMVNLEDKPYLDQQD